MCKTESVGVAEGWANCFGSRRGDLFLLQGERLFKYPKGWKMIWTVNLLPIWVTHCIYLEKVCVVFISEFTYAWKKLLHSQFFSSSAAAWACNLLIHKGRPNSLQGVCGWVSDWNKLRKIQAGIKGPWDHKWTITEAFLHNEYFCCE